MSQSRQLAVIMFTDIVGYTALMGKDEQEAFELLNKNRQIQKPIIQQFNGRWIKEIGDGVMASFNTVSDAVSAAIKIQQECNASKRFQLRIGIHLGEVVFEDDDVFGDGVNIASRIQAIANPGSIFVSESVHDNVINKKDIITAYYNTVILKNVKEPVRIYQVTANGVVSAPPNPVGKKIKTKWGKPAILFTVILLLAAGYFLINFLTKQNSYQDANINEKSIAILPFVDLSPGKDHEYLSDGLAEEILNSITIIKGLKVIGRTSSFQYKGKGLDARTIGEKLNVNIVLEGSIQRSGNVLRIITQLVRVKDNSTIWSQRFDKELKDIFAIQDSISSKIVEKLKITLSESERPRLNKKETDPEVYSLYLRGLYTYKEENYDKSLEYNLQAVGMDSLYAPSYAYIALAKTWKIYRAGSFSDFGAISEAKEIARRSIRLDPNLAEGYSALALLGWAIELDFAAAKLNFEKSIQLNPSATLIKSRYAYFLLWMGDFDKAEKLGLDAVSSDPADYNGYILVSGANMYKKNFREADKYIAEGHKLFPENLGFIRQGFYSKLLSGNYEEVIQSTKNILAENPNFVQENLLPFLCISYFKKGNISESNNILRQIKEKLPNQNSNIHYSLARIYSQYQMKDSCFLYLEKSFNNREPDFKLLKIDPLLEHLRQDPRYRQLYHRYGFDRYR